MKQEKYLISKYIDIVKWRENKPNWQYLDGEKTYRNKNGREWMETAAKKTNLNPRLRKKRRRK